MSMFVVVKPGYDLLFYSKVAARQGISTFYCLMSSGMSKCVDGPKEMVDEVSYCEYRLCGSSIIRWPQCVAPGITKATDFCTIVVQETNVWKCLENTKPCIGLSCPTGDYCACDLKVVQMEILTSLTVTEPFCPEGSPWR